MVKVYWDNADLVIEGHAKRETCAAVSAAVQTACLIADNMNLVEGDLTEPMEQRGGLAVIHTDRLKDDGDEIVMSLLIILQAQAEAWPGEIELHMI